MDIVTNYKAKKISYNGDKYNIHVIALQSYLLCMLVLQYDDVGGVISPDATNDGTEHQISGVISQHGTSADGVISANEVLTQHAEVFTTQDLDEDSIRQLISQHQQSGKLFFFIIFC